MKFEEDDKPKWMSKISYEQNGLFGVDVKSHQAKLPYHTLQLPMETTVRTQTAKT